MRKASTEPGALPRPAVTGVAFGLCLMALFTLIWAGMCFGGLNGTPYWFAPLLFPFFSIWFAVNAVRLFKIAKFFPMPVTEADIAEEKRTGKWFGIIFGAEGLLIFIGINIVVNLGYPDLTVPTIALVVGLHFFPLAKAFKRTIDYYLASWSTLVSLCGFVFTLRHIMPVNYVMAFLGAGLALATTCYGLYMIGAGRNVMKQVPVSGQA
jgi:hypothetical protein